MSYLYSQKVDTGKTQVVSCWATGAAARSCIVIVLLELRLTFWALFRWFLRSFSKPSQKAKSQFSSKQNYWKSPLANSKNSLYLPTELENMWLFVVPNAKKPAHVVSQAVHAEVFCMKLGRQSDYFPIDQFLWSCFSKTVIRFGRSLPKKQIAKREPFK